MGVRAQIILNMGRQVVIDGDCGAGIAHVLVKAGQSGDHDCAVAAAIAGIVYQDHEFS